MKKQPWTKFNAKGVGGWVAVLLASTCLISAQDAESKIETSWTDKLPDFIKDGKPILDIRVRYEYADNAVLHRSHAFTERLRLGYETAPYYGFFLGADFEDIRVIGSKRNANFAGLNGEPTKTVVADPEATELNQGFIGFSMWDTVAKLGRQRITLDNHRFIGNVVWRQNEQTYDGFSIKNSSIKDVELFYAYLSNVNRIFGDDHPAGDFNSDSHIMHASYSGLPWGKLTAYAYLLEFDNSQVNSCNTFGGSFVGSQKLNDDWKVNYHAEFAHQTDAGGSPLSYDANYVHLNLGANYKIFNFGGGYELLGSDGGVASLRTPLSTAHAFNGWADLFLTTPAAGLQDFYVSAGAKLPYDIPMKVIFHHFKSDTGNIELGNEINAIATKKFNDRWSALAKFAYYMGDNGIPDTQRFWLQAEYSF